MRASCSARASRLLIVALVAAIVAPIGLAVGMAAGYFGGLVDTALTRVIDIFLAFPRLILALAFAAALGPGIANAVIAISLTAWPPYARIARAETASIARSDFIAAPCCRARRRARILLRHIAPLCVSSLIVRLTLDMAGIILTAAGLGFLGLGAQPPTPEWGAMVASGPRRDPRSVVGGDHSRTGDLRRQPRLQPAGRRIARRFRSEVDMSDRAAARSRGTST